MNKYFKATYKFFHIYKKKHISYRCYKKSCIKYIDTDVFILSDRSNGKKDFLERLAKIRNERRYVTKSIKGN